MPNRSRYPYIGLRSKNEIAKRISDSNLSFREALSLINRILENFDEYWHDSERSEPEKEKYVRSAFGTPLGELLSRIDKKILVPYDKMVPSFIFGGLSGRSHVQAAKSLLGKKRGRILLGLDIKRFFEQISETRISYFFNNKCGCSKVASKLLARICCVPLGPKKCPGPKRALARGFATSTRLAVWCNLDTFLKVQRKVKRLLHGHDPVVISFVDDIGISASNVTEETMLKVEKTVIDILLHSDRNQPLPINPTKTKKGVFGSNAEILGTSLGRRGISVGSKARSRMQRVRRTLSNATSIEERKKLIRQLRGQKRYKKQVSSA